MPPHRFRPGFTLIDLLLAVVIVGILAAIAIPTFNNQLMAGRRADAIVTLTELQIAQERWRAGNVSYAATLIDLNWPGTDSRDGFYTLDIIAPGPAGYTITATPRSGGPQTADACGIFAVDQDGPLHGAGYAGPECWKR